MNLKSNNSSALFPLGLLVLGMCLAVYCYNKPLGDFANYYFGSNLLINGANVWQDIYNIAAFNNSVISKGYTGLFLSHTSVAPQSLLFYVPFALIPDPYLAKFVFNLTGIMSLSGVFYAVQQKQALASNKGILLVFIFLPVLYVNLLFGQTYIFIATIFLFVLFYSDRYPIVSALLLAVAISLKISPLVLLMYFVFKRQYRFVATTVAFTAAIFFLSLLCIGAETMHNFYRYILPKLLNGFVNDPFSASYHSLIVLLRKLFLYDELLNPHVYKRLSLEAISIISLLVTSGLLFFVLKASAAKNMPKGLAFLLLLLFVNSSSGYTTTYGLMMLFPLFFDMKESRQWFLLFLLALICWLPPLLFEKQSPILIYFKLYLFLTVIVTLVIQYKEQGNYKMALGITVVFALIGLIKLVGTTSVTPFRYYNASVYHHDYILEAHVKGDTLLYSYFDANGFHQATAIEERIATPCKIQEDENKSKVSFLEDGTQVVKLCCWGDSVLVLSDYNRGPGLFNLYALPQQQLETLLK